MAKATQTTIRLVNGQTVKVGKLSDRTFRTVKVGDYIPVQMTIRGVVCKFYALVDKASQGNFLVSFGSYGMTVPVSVPKGMVLNVYRPN
jgi:phosphotransferase system IIA component